jgi:hypothetical protein
MATQRHSGIPPQGALDLISAYGVVNAVGAGAPTASAAGYSKGCLYLDLTNGAMYLNTGTVTTATWVRQDTALDFSGLTATATELNRLDEDFAVLATLAGTGITGGVGTVYKTQVLKVGLIVSTLIYIDITGLDAVATDGDVIGAAGTNPAYLGQITAARNGTIDAIRVTCLELPAGASADIDIFTANVATGKKDDAAGGLTGGAALVTAGGAWTNGMVKGATAMPPANDYLYLANGAGANAGTYTGGKFLLELIGY